MAKPQSVYLTASNEMLDANEEWPQFLLDEGLEALAAYRSIQDPCIRRTFVNNMKKAAAAEQQAKPGRQ